MENKTEMDKWVEILLTPDGKGREEKRQALITMLEYVVQYGVWNLLPIIIGYRPSEKKIPPVNNFPVPSKECAPCDKVTCSSNWSYGDPTNVRKCSLGECYYRKCKYFKSPDNAENFYG